MSAPPLPPGWAGKCWACDRGTATRRGGDELLVLLDADVRLHPGALDALRDAHRHHGGLLSVQPYHDTIRPYEQLSALFNVIALSIAAVQVFAVPYVMFRQPDGQNPAGHFYTMYLYENAFVYGKMGYASAMAWLQLAVVLALTAVMLFASRRLVHYTRV